MMEKGLFSALDHYKALYAYAAQIQAAEQTCQFGLNLAFAAARGAGFTAAGRLNASTLLPPLTLKAHQFINTADLLIKSKERPDGYCKKLNPGPLLNLQPEMKKTAMEHIEPLLQRNKLWLRRALQRDIDDVTLDILTEAHDIKDDAYLKELVRYSPIVVKGELELLFNLTRDEIAPPKPHLTLAAPGRPDATVLILDNYRKKPGPR